jgi:hypothetical protein
VVFRACPASLENHGLAEALTLRNSQSSSTISYL